MVTSGGGNSSSMAELDPISWVLPLIISTVIPFALLSINRFSKTSEGTLTGTIRLEGLKSNVDDTKEAMQIGFNKLEELINRKDGENKESFLTIHRRLEIMATDLKLHEYRLNQIDRQSGRSSRGVSGIDDGGGVGVGVGGGVDR
jgi:hypothetical protein